MTVFSYTPVTPGCISSLSVLSWNKRGQNLAEVDCSLSAQRIHATQRMREPLAFGHTERPSALKQTHPVVGRMFIAWPAHLPDAFHQYLLKSEMYRFAFSSSRKAAPHCREPGSMHGLLPGQKPKITRASKSIPACQTIIYQKHSWTGIRLYPVFPMIFICLDNEDRKQHFWISAL